MHYCDTLYIILGAFLPLYMQRYDSAKKNNKWALNYNRVFFEGDFSFVG